MIEQKLVKLFEKSLKQNWNLPAFSNYREDSLTYRQIAHKIIFFHKYFELMDIKEGTKIAVFGKNSVNWAICYLSAVTYGAVIVPILPDFKPGDVHHIVNHSDAKLLFAADSLFDNLDENSMNDLEAVISLNDFSILFKRKKNANLYLDKAEATYLTKFDGNLTLEKIKFKEISNDKLAAIIYTSGTTGFSKGVMLAHNSLISNIIFAQENMPLDPGDTIVSFLPIAHVFGCAFEFLFPFSSGCHITFLGKTPSPKILIKSFQEIHPRLILSVPLVIEKIYRKQIKPKLDKPIVKALLHIPPIRKKIYGKINATLTEVFGGNFREIVLGGAALNKEVETFLRDIKFRYTVGYGMTECGPLISYVSWKNFKRSSCGKVVDNMEARIDSNDPQNEVGEILVRGENVMNGYYKNKEATAAAIDEEGWLHTGDLGILDNENNVFIKGRSKSMILGASGKNIYPEELEARLNNLPFVQESIVIEKDGKLVALVYPDMEAVDSEKIDEHELNKKMEENRILMNKYFPAYMAINRIEIYPEEFEKTPKRSIKRFLYSN
ncbi:MAG: AMP-binding protein [Candidatus Cloacimonetes bacterium]|nr:AMP-binding protein [Candidatus Cloacimonadota bacterium]MCF7867336.1 AMP-binding protein [Candidatus Cloacimonadota bacterium]MCF7882770.1 AMP-binding protein [Candidatus Cloacimonadota bacterium]